MTREEIAEFPLVLYPTSELNKDSVVKWVQESRSQLKLNLLENGGILFRDFPVEDYETLHAFIQALNITPLPYIGGAAPRRTVYKDIHTTNESPPDQPIPFHHEMSQVPVYPTSLFFYCEIPSTEGGETPILLSDKIYDLISKKYPQFVIDLETKGVIYTRIIPMDDDPSSPIGRGWINTFQTNDPEEAKAKAKNLNVSLEWLSNGDVKTVSPILDAIKTYTPNYPGAKPLKVWFNSLIAAYVGWRDVRNDPTKAITFGDGTLMNPDIIEGIVKLMDESCVAFKWKKGDILWLDNNRVMHSRKPFVMPRRIVAYLGQNELKVSD